ncbi:MAG: 3-deoxy-7-phosphoheptulonate synthase [candidate division KSB1 bacterium]|nr:3-deoxy-7-phosphoheptulonate synthase [candidate division KSB1 bacterium]
MSSQIQLREKLFKLDEDLLRNLAKRKQLLTQLTEAEGLIFGNRAQENGFISRLIQQGKNLGLDSYFINRVYREIFDYSQRLQEELLKLPHPQDKPSKDQIVVTFQGVEEAYSHLAGQKFFSTQLDRVVFQGLPTFKALVESVEKGEADYAILPIENTTAGSINETYDLLNQAQLTIIGEEILPVEHCLLAIEKVPLARIRRIYSHPQALAQCSNFLSSLQHCTVESFVDTALAVKKVKEDEDLSEAAIASEEAAELYGLQIIKRDIANTRENYTRFVIVAREAVEYSDRIPCKTSLIFATKHVEGALVKCLNVLARHHLNMTKLESRPRPNIPWEYLFYVDFEGNIKQDHVKKALEELSTEVSYMKVLGSYPAKIASAGQRGEAVAVPEEARQPEVSVEEAVPQRPGAKIKVPETKPYRLASRFYKEEDTLIKVKDVIIGGKEFVVIAGPCAVESEAQILECAREVAENGGHILRGGVFKPRTSPYSFQGLGYEGLEHLVQAGNTYKLPIITEVLHPKDVKKVAEVADILQIGARNMQNFSLLREVGQVNRPVLLKRGMMASVDELLAAAEYILAQGNQQVILCERGIRTFETATRNTLDLSAVPVLRYYSHLPVLVDPSHASGDWRWVIPLVEAALAVGANGVMVEIHPDPDKALSDGAQSLKFDNFEVMMKRLKRLKAALG